MILCGIDPSLTGTAVVVSDPANGPEAFRLARFSSKNQGDDVRSRIKRFELMISQIDAYLKHSGVSHVWIEGYSHASKFNVSILGEFGGLLRWHLIEREFVAEVAPTTLKKFATGAGNTKGKDLLAAHVANRWGVMFDNSDAFDAYSLWRLGRCCMSIDIPANQAQREAVGKVMHIDVPKEKKPRRKPEPKPF